MTDRTAPAKEASADARSALTDEALTRSIEIGRQTLMPHDSVMANLIDAAVELQSRRSSPVREGEGGLPDLSRGEVAPSMGSLTPDGYKPAPAYRPDPPRSQMAQSNDHARSGSPSLSPSEPSGRGESGGILPTASEASMNKEDARQKLVDYFATIQDCIRSIQGALRHRQQPQDYHFHTAEKACRDGASFVATLLTCSMEPISAGSMPPSSSDRDTVIEEMVVEIERYNEGLVPELKCVIGWLVPHLRSLKAGGTHEG